MYYMYIQHLYTHGKIWRIQLQLLAETLAKQIYIILYVHVYVHVPASPIIESVDSISRDGPDMPYIQYITKTLIIIILLTEHDFIGGDDDVELECVRDDLPAGVPVVELVLVDQPATVDAAVVDDHVKVTPRLKLSLPVGDGGEGSYH